MNERPTEFLEADEVRRLLATADRRTHQGRRDAAVLRVLAEGGLREGEVCSLVVGNLRSIQGCDSLHFESLKKRSGRRVLRVVPLTRDAVADIRRYWLSEYRADTPAESLPAFRTLGARGPYNKAPLSAKLTGSWSERLDSRRSRSASRRTPCGIPVRPRSSGRALTSKRSE